MGDELIADCDAAQASVLGRNHGFWGYSADRRKGKIVFDRVVPVEGGEVNLVKLDFINAQGLPQCDTEAQEVLDQLAFRPT